MAVEGVGAVVGGIPVVGGPVVGVAVVGVAVVGVAVIGGVAVMGAVTVIGAVAVSGGVAPLGGVAVSGGVAVIGVDDVGGAVDVVAGAVVVGPIVDVEAGLLEWDPAAPDGVVELVPRVVLTEAVEAAWDAAPWPAPQAAATSSGAHTATWTMRSRSRPLGIAPDRAVKYGRFMATASP
jgi:hypothetical protein